MALYTASSLSTGTLPNYVGSNFGPPPSGMRLSLAGTSLVSTTQGSGSGPTTPQYYWSS